MNATMKIPPEKLPYRGEPTREAHITDEELRMIEAGEKIVKPTGRVALKGKRKQKNLTCQRITKPWTPEEEESLIAAYKNGEMVSDICAETGRTRDAIEHRLRKLSNAGRLIMRPHGRTRKEK